ncbi:class I SAM-dependent rRNA methyltransferase [Inhella crocodyli]|uniref:23S rRNA (Cytosine(1962)-C(5))-methyltransferase RlmI n=1 Tax=Inhella crocodyli TaxID=2499851 RepID=A0A437LTP1_9BURK|nr:class I SAM-dependent methyltransferase [Inhella crocodyli]RVT88758.1 23S rRNA (cytosine(1962)-C(5))-methyltransferase RlmI [Inhella crocodyli]
MPVIQIRPGKERSLQRRHPWVFDGAIQKGKAEFGETVRVVSTAGEFLCTAAYSPNSSIKLRAWSFDEAERIDADFFERRLRAAVALRERLGIESNGVRLVHGEADGLPGLIVDRYADTLVAQFGAAGTEAWKATIADALLRVTGLTRLYERSDSGVRQLEGLPPVTGWLRGEGSTTVELIESSWRLTLDVAEGHKTGYYLDQRDNRREFAGWVRRLNAQRVLNCFSYTGGFSVAALAGGATEVTSVDSSAPALARASAHVTLNGFDPAHHTALDADVNATLRRFLQEGRQFDAIVLDPPKYAPSAAHAERAAKAYKDINRLGLQLLAPGGLLATYSCSGGVGPELFHQIVTEAGQAAGVDGAIVGRLSAAADHPQTLCFPEGEYLKGLLVIKR